MAPSQTALTSYLLGNLHCPSCVAAIRSLLAETYGDRIKWVSPNLVTSVVTVEHQANIPGIIQDMAKTLEDVGFEVCAVDSSGSSIDSLDSITVVDSDEGSLVTPQQGSAFNVFSWLWQSKAPASQEAARAAHLENCEACRSGLPHDAPSRSESPSQSSTPIVPAGLDSIVTSDVASNGPWRATLSVGGMTCAVCTNTITNEMEKRPWISKVRVNLVANSAVVDYIDHDRTQDIVDGIEDLGYDATLDNVQDLGQDSKKTDAREVEIQIDGIFCPRCPTRIHKTMKNFGTKNIEVLKKPTLNRPFLKIRYTPSSPNFTVRHILKAIEATDPSLTAHIYHPPTLEERSRAIRAKHQKALLRRMILALILAVPTLIFGIVYMSLVSDSDPTKHFLMKPWVSGLSRLEIILFALATPVYFFGADIFHSRAIKEVWTMWKSGSRTSLAQRFYKFGSMNLLISLGTTIAYFSSVAQMIASAINHDTDVPADRFYFDSVVFLTLFLLAGRLIEAYSKSKTGSAVEALAKLRPNTALLVEQDKAGDVTTTTIPLDQLEHGDIIRVPHGASPAADGIILTGETNFDESSLTGESRPIKKAQGDQVYAGTVNKGSSITIRVTGTSGKSMLDQIVEVVREGQTKRAPVEQIADLMTSYFVPVVTLIAIVTWVVWMVLVQTGRVSGEETDSKSGRIAFAFQFAIAVFVVACPCGLGLAAPTAIFVGGGIAANHGILVKGGGEAFEKASRIDCVVFDKTGTLTVGGEPQITDSAILPEGPIKGVEESQLLAGLKAVEENSTHPIARAIVGFCGADRSSAELESIDEVPGKGMKATFQGLDMSIAVGNEALMKDLQVSISDDTRAKLNTWKTEAKSVALVAIEASSSWHLGAILAISDAIRDETIPVIRALQARGTQVWMLSGDNLVTAKAVAQVVGIPAAHVLAEVLPSEKADKVRYLQATASASASSGRAMVAMVGDGINDSPALTTADIGIAIGSGSDVAISSADFVLASSQLTAVLTLLDLSRVVFRRIKMNFGWALVYNMVALPIAAGCLYAVRTGGGAHVKLDPVWASLAMALSSLSVVLSSLSLRSRIPLIGFRAKKVAV